MPTLKAEFSGGNDNGATVHSPPATKAAVGGGKQTKRVKATGEGDPNVGPTANPLTEAASPAESAAGSSPMLPAALGEGEGEEEGEAEAEVDQVELDFGKEEEAKPAEVKKAREEAAAAMPYEHTVILFDISKLAYNDNELENLENQMVTELEKKAKKKINHHSISVTGVKPNSGMTSRVMGGRTYQYLGITLDLTNLNNETDIENKEIFEICSAKCRESLLLNLTERSSLSKPTTSTSQLV